jgi:hypothetical protein
MKIFLDLKKWIDTFLLFAKTTLGHVFMIIVLSIPVTIGDGLFFYKMFALRFSDLGVPVGFTYITSISLSLLICGSMLFCALNKYEKPLKLLLVVSFLLNFAGFGKMLGSQFSILSFEAVIQGIGIVSICLIPPYLIDDFSVLLAQKLEVELPQFTALNDSANKLTANSMTLTIDAVKNEIEIQKSKMAMKKTITSPKMTLAS